MEQKHCPNCGAEISENTINCEYCGFVVADKEALNFIDKAILKIENNIQKLSEITSANFFDISIVFALFMFGILTFLFVFPGIFEIFLIIAFIKNKRLKKLLYKFKSTKLTYEEDFDNFSLLYPKNQKLAELKQEYQNKVSANLKKLKKNLISSSVVFGILFFGLFVFLASAFGNDGNKGNFLNRTAIIHPVKIKLDADENFSVFSNNFYINFTAEPPNNKHSKVMVTLNDIIIKTDNHLLDSLSKAHIEFYISDTAGNILDFLYQSDLQLDTVKKSNSDNTFINVKFTDTLLVPQTQADQYASNLMWNDYFIVNIKIR